METALNTYVNSKTLIGEVVRDYPESIEDPCMVHGIDSELLLNALNHVIDMKKA